MSHFSFSALGQSGSKGENSRKRKLSKALGSLFYPEVRKAPGQLSIAEFSWSLHSGLIWF
jgi:hypothetical protein